NPELSCENETAPASDHDDCSSRRMDHPPLHLQLDRSNKSRSSRMQPCQGEIEQDADMINNPDESLEEIEAGWNPSELGGSSDNQNAGLK
ncbi:MAG: hypothetical protein Q9210_005160, partial [Variospora velana]